MAELFPHVMKAIDKMEQLARRDTPVTPDTVAQGVRQVYADQGLPLDEALLHEAVSPAQAVAPAPVAPEKASAPPGGLSLIEVFLALTVVVALTLPIFAITSRARHAVAVNEVATAATELEVTLQSRPEVSPAEWRQANPDWFKELNALGDLTLQPSPNTSFVLSHVKADQCPIVREALVKNAYLWNPSPDVVEVRINGVGATTAGAVMNLPCDADNTLSYEHHPFAGGSP